MRYMALRSHSILSQEIGKVIPEMLKDTRKAIFDVRSDLARLGPPLGTTDDVRREFNNIIDVRSCCKFAEIRHLWRELYKSMAHPLQTVPNLPHSICLNHVVLATGHS